MFENCNARGAIHKADENLPFTSSSYTLSREIVKFVSMMPALTMTKPGKFANRAGMF